MTESHTEEASVVSSTADVGKRLREAREAKKISITDAAAQLRVTRDAIVHLEEQNWDRLHGRTYARGYFLSYAKFLGLPQDEMLAGFNIEFNETIDHRTPSIAPIQQIRPAKSSFQLLPFLLLIIVGILAWFAYQQWQLTQTDNQISDIPNQPLIEPLDPLETSEMSPIPVTESATEQFVDIDEPLISSEELAEDLIQNDSSQVDPIPVMAESELEATAPTVAEDSSQKNLIIGINSDCWVEVRDANQQVLISRVVRGGNTVELTGTSPLQVSLGQANAASVRFDGEIIDISGYTRGNVARFTLGADS
ncbi:MAG: helix-turn-helix domain-containing protein [Methylophaga nitratireducenticrescens]|uniref:RodZ domain-containing protein n=1 Tax=Methylophaga sp. SB9B TaxID=2570356 RepID=UPI0010A8319D|nr:RodZ domain-containing protein [Methylophaga sp. SB9B]THF54314.1 MAG: helix-turn-helix domain-containing protein [Methylophaga nitratireducenticrescens]THK40373.1 helix-turn-helix domain-containing protein [Methylophaga sp. SB9B]